MAEQSLERARAFIELGRSDEARVLSDWALLRTLPWRYIARLPFRHGWIAVAGWSLVVMVVCGVLTLALPDRDASDFALEIAWLAAAVGLVSSWVRAILMRVRLRGRRWRFPGRDRPSR